ncbi:putative rhamnosidase B [Aspergillus fischeri NRRL 181]|uniref:Bacterial alpha-L-rhamnosidase domain protein n=1 Tax=Neosartorya fischeri (strain ATCC 1020 / DSM 3700 / CBS 544.65 / FGSC A1164 / JCM 1740 / NRRL 181 / WB 181) TaxID=331117 RepID=A1DCH9_NEOFI|nr:bacterial alpha-L-rhamnosidase domain protein [Aspergillus fischeri NRRL 181]EAW19539.1 bacterial alpha-L-rhamnosidase domain protein [Aspergillus fischeri NRRL 181]
MQMRVGGLGSLGAGRTHSLGAFYSSPRPWQQIIKMPSPIRGTEGSASAGQASSSAGTILEMLGSNHDTRLHRIHLIIFKMKFIVVVNALIVALCSHVALASTIGHPSLMPREDALSDNNNSTVSTPYGNIVSTVLEDGKKKMEFFDVDGTLEVTAIETADGTATFYDAEGKEVNLADMDDDDEDLEKRVPKWKLAIKFAKLVAKYGKRAWSYIYCVGTAPFWKCGDETINSLQSNWIWAPNWIDSSPANTAGKIVRFTHNVSLISSATRALVHCSADTRYKLYVNGVRAAVGPARGSPLIWYYDTVDIAPYLRVGENEIVFVLVRYFNACRGAMPFERTAFPGLTVVGTIETQTETVDVQSREGWLVQVDESVRFPMGLVDDMFLHINERITPTVLEEPVTPMVYGMRTANGDLSPWRLRPRQIPMPAESSVGVALVRKCQSNNHIDEWTGFLNAKQTLALAANSSHVLEIQADVHSTAFLRWSFRAVQASRITLKITYSEGYEQEPRSYPFFRTKADRLDAENGRLIGPYDEVTFDLPAGETTVYEPFWFRTFRLIRLEIASGPAPVELLSFGATQVNYPMAVKASWQEDGGQYSERIWEVSIRTMRNCMFDGYSDCPFYEQLQYSGDSRSVGLFHYLLSGDDRLMRQAITNFAASVTPEGLTQSRFPSHVPQIIAGFSLYWILQVCDHRLHFGDRAYARSFLPRIDGVLEFFHAHIDPLGLVSNLPDDVWQYVDWVTTWGATDTHPDKGVPTSGRQSNRHTFFSLLYAYVLNQAAQLLHDVGRPGHAAEYTARAEAVLASVRKHCYDGRFFTDSTAEIADEGAYSQHCQVFAVLAGAVAEDDRARLLTESFAEPGFAKCSYVMQFYALRAFSLAGDEAYEAYWGRVWDPWRRMLECNLTTWEEDNVRQRSDCHAWGSVPIYEYCTELAGVRIDLPGATRVLFKPRLRLSKGISARVAVGKENVATVRWETVDGEKRVELRFERAVDVVSQLPGEKAVEHGVVQCLFFTWKGH